MRGFSLIALMLAACFALSGCAFRAEVENQAYVLILGIERREDGMLELTARVPKIGESSNGNKEGGTASPYQTFSARGTNWVNALENLQWITPRELNLSHIKLMIVSDTLASEAGFSRLIREIAETPHLYTTAHFAVCDGEVSAFVDAMQPVIGTRLSSDVDAAMRHYAAHGYIPESLFAEVCCVSDSFYSDLVAARCFAGDIEETKAAAAIIVPDDASADTPKESPQRFGGCFVFRQGTLALSLDMRETQLLGLVLGNADSLELERDGVPCALRLEGKPSLAVDIRNHTVVARLEMRFSCLEVLDGDVAAALSNQLEAEFEALIRRCQAAHVEPFGFAAAAARRFLTDADWMAFDWRSRFAQSTVNVDISVIPGS